jgi:hypothetical protein
MRVNIGPYCDWWGPYQIADAIIWWQDKYNDECPWADRAHKLGEFFAHGFHRPDRTNVFSRKREHKTWLYKLCEWIHSKKHRKIQVHIDRWDTWSLDNTMAYIILPALKQLKATQHGYTNVALEDVPEHLQVVEHEDWSDQLELFADIKRINPENLSIAEERWNWVVDEMIWAFEQVNTDWEDQYDTGTADFVTKPVQHNGQLMYEMVQGPEHTLVTDWAGREAHYKRMQNGFRLFGKYYQNLWD